MGSASSTRRGGTTDHERTSVLFVGGYDRSGSTLLDCMLGQLPGFFSTGETNFIWERGIRRNEGCGCGMPFLECPFWASVRQRTFEAQDNSDPATILTLQRSVQRIRNLPRLGLAGIESRAWTERFDAYERRLARLYAAIRSTSGCDMIVDSSKDPVHGFVLAASDTVDLHVVHLVRDSRAVAFSHQRVKPRSPGREGGDMRRLSPERVAVGWSFTNGLMHLLRHRASSYVRVRYGDLVRAPREAVGTVVDSLGLRRPPMDFITDDGVHLAPTHTVSGNPTRFEHGLVALKLDSEWQKSMRSGKRRIVTALTWPLLLRYGLLGHGEEAA